MREGQRARTSRKRKRVGRPPTTGEPGAAGRGKAESLCVPWQSEVDDEEGTTQNRESEKASQPVASFGAGGSGPLDAG